MRSLQLVLVRVLRVVSEDSSLCTQIIDNQESTLARSQHFVHAHSDSSVVFITVSGFFARVACHIRISGDPIGSHPVWCEPPALKPSSAPAGQRGLRRVAEAIRSVPRDREPWRHRRGSVPRW